MLDAFAWLALVSMPTATDRPARTERRRTRFWVGVVAAMLVSASLLALVFLPARSASKEISVSSEASATTVFSFAGPTWVTVHFDRHGSMGMQYWMTGPGGMMFNRSMMGSGMMGGSDSYSFWTWGGDYRCGAGFSGAESGSMPVWVNASWGLL